MKNYILHFNLHTIYNFKSFLLLYKYNLLFNLNVLIFYAIMLKFSAHLLIDFFLYKLFSKKK